MSSTAAVHLLTPADLETRLAALGIPVARLIAAARIARSTWSDWRAGRTRPRPDRWSAATEAFAALVAEAEAAPPAEPAVAGVVSLAGSSTPTGEPPSFTPLATAPAPAEAPIAAAPLTSAAPAIDDGALWAALDCWTAATRADAEAQERLMPIEAALFADGVPAPLLCSLTDEELFPDVWSFTVEPGRWFGHVDSLAALASTKAHGAAAARRDEILAAARAWAEARGEAEPTRAWSDAWDALYDAARRKDAAIWELVEVPAVTLDGLLAKVAAIFDDYLTYARPLARVHQRITKERNEGSSPGAADAVVRDLLRMLVSRGITSASEVATARRLPAASADLARLTAEWVRTNSLDGRDRDAVASMPPSAFGEPGALDVFQANAREHLAVLHRIAALRSTAPDFLALKAAAVLAGCHDAAGLDEEIARGDGAELNSGDLSVALSLARDVAALFPDRVAPLVAAANAAADLPTIDRSAASATPARSAA